MADRSKKELNEIIEKHIMAWKGTSHGAILLDAYKGGKSYESLCLLMGLDPDEYLDEEGR